MSKKRCETCRYFEPYWEDGDPPPYTGDCKRYPPVWVCTDYDIEYDVPIDSHMWSVPHVGAMGCCGEWKKAKK